MRRVFVARKLRKCHACGRMDHKPHARLCAFCGGQVLETGMLDMRDMEKR